MRRTHKIMTLFMGMLFLLCAPLHVSAHSTDVPFEITINSSGSNFSDYSAQKKDNSTSSYIKYNSSGGPYKVIALIYGAKSEYGTYIDLTSREFYSNEERRDAVVTRGTKGFIRQDVYEAFGERAWARLHMKKYGSYLGTARGVWSPDSVYESGCIEYND